MDVRKKSPFWIFSKISANISIKGGNPVYYSMEIVSNKKNYYMAM